MTLAQVDLTVASVRRCFDRAAAVSDALIIDARGVTAEFDWDEFVLYGSGSPVLLPDTLILRPREDRPAPDVPAGGLVTPLGDGLLQIQAVPA